MDTERQRRIFELADLIQGLEEAERRSRLQSECAGDAALLAEVEALVGSTDSGSGVLERPVFDIHADDRALGRRIGPYRLVELLDRGGMGTVYRAERDDFEKAVALKLIRRGLDSDGNLIRRFHNERQILARLEHPHIAHLLDGGTTDDHLPFFVMELVDGSPMDRYCADHDLGIEARLKLFEDVCSAVHFAHQNLVIHRDLKPDNILITADGQPKLLDFGIAKLLDDSLSAEPMATATGHAPMTPRYASPEQIQGQPLTTASDIYSLGVLLYELLTGLDPYDAEGRRPDEVSRAICEDEPPRPSTAVKRLPEGDSPRIRKLRRQLSGDLDCIVLKALRKEPGQRYRSAEEFQRDVHHHLIGLPVSARAGTASYRLSKFIRRHWAPLLVAALYFATSTGFGITVWNLLQEKQRTNSQLEQAYSELEKLRDEAVAAQFETQAAKELSESAWKFLIDVFDVNRLRKGLKNPTALDILNEAKLRAETIEDPAMQIEVYSNLALIFRNLGERQSAKEALERALTLAWQHLPSDDDDDDRLAQLESNYVTVSSLDVEDYRNAVEAYRHLLRIRRQNGHSGAKLWKLQGNLATALMRQGQFGEAQDLYELVLKGRQGKYSPDNLRLLPSYLNLAALHYARGDFRSARRYVDTTLEFPSPAATDDAFNTYENLRATALNLSGKIYAAGGSIEDAKDHFHQALEIRRPGSRPADLKSTAIIRKNLAAAIAPSDPTEASRLVSLALPVFEANFERSWLVADAQSIQGEILTLQGEFAAAERLLRSAHRRLVDVRGAAAYPAVRARQRCLDLYAAWQRPDLAQSFREQFPEPQTPGDLTH